jgi:GDP-L-fucose synthase
LKPTDEPYAIAKIAGIKICDAYRSQYGCNFISAMPTNLYGPNDNFDLNNSHVLPALIQKFVEAKKQDLPEVEIWGTGKPRREFMHVDDLAEACFFLMTHYDEPGFVNVGTESDVTINELAKLIRSEVGFTGEVTHNTSQPDGTPQKLMDVSKINGMGWKYSISLEEGVKRTVRDYINSLD